MENNWPLSLVEKMSFVRYGGTQEELRAAHLLQETIASFGGTSELMDFSVPAYELETCTAAVTAPYQQALEVIPYGISGQLPEGGVELKLFYLERSDPMELIGLKSLEGYAVLINALDYDTYKLLVQYKASAFITIAGKWYDDDSRSDLVPRNLRPKFLELGQIPGFSIWAKDATELLRKGAQIIRLELREIETTHTSRNVLAVIPGTDLAEEAIVLTAHYDSVLVGTGSWDNATGSAILMELYRRFLKKPARRTLRFIWCGSEEQGLLGSKAYVAQNPELVEQIQFCFNFDMCGTVLGPNRIFVTGGDDLKSYADQIAKEAGFSAEISVHVHSSDSAPFCDAGIPAIGISRGTKTAEIHTRNDLMFPLCAQSILKTGDFAELFIGRVANAAVLPVKREMCDEMKQALDKYFMRDKTPLEK